MIKIINQINSRKSVSLNVSDIVTSQADTMVSWHWVTFSLTGSLRIPDQQKKYFSINPFPSFLDLLKWLKGNMSEGIFWKLLARKQCPLDGLIFEEVVYAHGMKFKHKRSMGCRFFSHSCLPVTWFPSLEATTAATDFLCIFGERIYPYSSIYGHTHLFVLYKKHITHTFIHLFLQFIVNLGSFFFKIFFKSSFS